MIWLWYVVLRVVVGESGQRHTLIVCGVGCAKGEGSLSQTLRGCSAGVHWHQVVRGFLAGGAEEISASAPSQTFWNAAPR